MLFGDPREFGHRRAQRGGDSLQRRPSGVGEAALDHAEGRGRDAGAMRGRRYSEESECSQFAMRLLS